MSIIIVLILVILSGTFSGLTLGMFSLNLTALERKIRLGDKKAKKVYPVRKKGNLLLCTLLLGNVAVNSAMAIFLGSIAKGFIAGLIATGLIVIFGEILPQAVFSRFALTLGANTAWLVRVFIVLLYPVSWPLSWMLDKMLGEELPVIWSKKEIKEIIKFHRDSPDSSIDRDEERISLGALSFSDQTAKDILTPKSRVYWLKGETIIDEKLLSEIKKMGFTRVPVFLETDKSKMGILFVKDLIGINVNGKQRVWELSRKENMIIIKESVKLDHLMNLFINRKMHLALVCDENNKFKGIVSLEDVIEEIIKEEIFDELDKTNE
ncbi:MAG: DUF21 domain-containing protein [Candidatus Aminicenantes bacterium]|nr:DUF21 domain-containing protein [Candidatus Aminicenantes bacterium]NIM80490.1 DUF21 domain-containing protein [Candidatus Aminicenantes bacterium]NIN23932.1 DUF21 domain-containing protein [Candidatus Aminicenantes bacterium]NIN47646.1 DUF21 domain-containing protein [Candidatus Aminicenantes bacterium]NIN90576.1 DUF21 domain-containing protein [Candidatus Aminicenantes bacterium]